MREPLINTLAQGIDGMVLITFRLEGRDELEV